MEDTGIKPHRTKRNEVLVSIRRPLIQHFQLEDRPRPFNMPYARWWANGEGQGRDSMKSKCYKAETAVRCVTTQKTFNELAEIAVYVRDTMEAEWFQRRWPYFRECFVAVKGAATCYGGPRGEYKGPDGQSHVNVGRIQMSTWGMGLHPWGEKGGIKDGGEIVVLHELAHALSPKREKHGRYWVTSFLELVRHRISAQVADALLESFRMYRLRTLPFRWVDEATKQHKLSIAACRPSTPKVKENPWQF